MKRQLNTFNILSSLVILTCLSSPVFAGSDYSPGIGRDLREEYEEAERRAAEARRKAAAKARAEAKKKEAAHKARIKKLKESIAADQAETKKFIENEMARIDREWIQQLKELDRDIITEDLILFLEDELKLYIEELINSKKNGEVLSRAASPAEKASSNSKQNQAQKKKKSVQDAASNSVRKKQQQSQSAKLRTAADFERDYEETRAALIKKSNINLIDFFQKRTAAVERRLGNRSLTIVEELIQNPKILGLQARLETFAKERAL